MFCILRDAFGPMDYVAPAPPKKDARHAHHAHKKTPEIIFNSYQNSIDNAAQVPCLLPCARLTRGADGAHVPAVPRLNARRFRLCAWVLTRLLLSSRRAAQASAQGITSLRQ
jgi:hypothetical protein